MYLFLNNFLYAQPALQLYSLLQGDLDTVQFLLNVGADVLAVDMRSDTPIENAKQHGHAEIYQLLSEVAEHERSKFHTQPLRSSARDPLEESTSTKSRTKSRLVLPNVVDDIESDLGSINANVDNKAPFWRAAMSTTGSMGEDTKESEASTPLLGGQRTDGIRSSTQQLLITAAGEGDLSEIKRLIRKGADPTFKTSGKNKTLFALYVLLERHKVYARRWENCSAFSCL